MSGEFSALYDLRYEQPSFDFYHWLVTAAGLGATEIVINTEGIEGNRVHSVQQIRRRFESIIAPGPALLGLPWREGTDGVRLDTAPKNKFKLHHFVEYVKRGGKWPTLKSVLPKGNSEYTVTIRKQIKSPYRNSDEAVWRRFANEIGALVIEDYDVKPISLHERMALYAGAKLNFGVSSGPMFLCTLTDYPSISFDWGKGVQESIMVLSGIEKGARLPWCDEKHVTSWKPQTFDNIMSEFRRWKARE